MSSNIIPALVALQIATSQPIKGGAAPPKVEDNFFRFIIVVLIGASVLTAVVIIALLSLTWGGDESKIISKSNIKGTGIIYTVEHDGHWWITKSRGNLNPAHHPDCPCQKNKPTQTP